MASAHVAAKVHIMHVGLRAADFLSVIAIVGHVFGSVVRAHRVVAQLLDPVLVGNSALDGALLTAIVAATATRSPPIPVAATRREQGNQLMNSSIELPRRREVGIVSSHLVPSRGSKHWVLQTWAFPTSSRDL